VNHFILLETADSVATITLNRPERHNSLVPDLLRQLLHAMEGVAANENIRAVVLQANGRSFSTGGDVRAFYEHLDGIEEYANLIVGLLNEVIVTMFNLPIPIVTAVHGLVTGGSLGLILASDIVLIAPDVRIMPYYSVVGFSPDGGWTALLPEIIGRKRTAEILMTNGTIDSHTTIDWGIADRCVAVDHIRASALETARTLAHQKPGSIRRTKDLLRLTYDKLLERLESERVQFVRQIITEEARAGMAAFLGIEEAELP
jgi:2-(1,2-epoxy-1,2-dihydrophenyl)acetyl-CoA isomerase